MSTPSNRALAYLESQGWNSNSLARELPRWSQPTLWRVLNERSRPNDGLKDDLFELTGCQQAWWFEPADQDASEHVD